MKHKRIDMQHIVGVRRQLPKVMKSGDHDSGMTIIVWNLTVHLILPQDESIIINFSKSNHTHTHTM